MLRISRVEDLPVVDLSILSFERSLVRSQDLHRQKRNNGPPAGVNAHPDYGHFQWSDQWLALAQKSPKVIAHLEKHLKRALTILPRRFL